MYDAHAPTARGRVRELSAYSEISSTTSPVRAESA